MVRKTYRPIKGDDTGTGVEKKREEIHEDPVEKEDDGGSDDAFEGEAKVLHVDDSPEFVEMASIYLQKGNDHLNIKTETDPMEALERLEEEEFDCVISDCSMPDMEIDGMEMHKRIRSKHPDLSFVFFTGTPISEFPKEVVDDEDTGHMQKEIDVKQFSNLAGWITETVE